MKIAIENRVLVVSDDEARDIKMFCECFDIKYEELC
jgi:hypothetical protein